MKDLKNNIARFFDNDSSEYLEHKYVRNSGSFMALRKERARDILLKYVAPSFNEGFEFLDCGCGPGILLDILSKYKICYWGIDLSEEMLKLARKQAEVDSSILVQKHFLRGDVENLPFKSDSFDAVASLGVIEYLQEDDCLLTEIARITKPNGYLLIAVTNKYSYNLFLEKPLNYLRRNGLTVNILNYLKVRLKLGQFRQMEFEKRRHSPNEFIKRLGDHNFKIVDSIYWGFNLLPHPLHQVCYNSWNKFTNSFYDKSNNGKIKLLGEGCMVLCQNNKTPKKA